MSPSRRQALAGIATTVAAACVAGPAEAHAFAQRYDLPIPLWLYLSAAGATVAASFVLVALYARRAGRAGAYPRVNLLAWGWGRALACPVTLRICRAASVAVFFLVVVAGLVGTQNPFRNLAPTMVWVIWWVGLAYVSALAGNLWALINPLDTVFAWGESLYGRLGGGRRLSFDVPYPRWLGAWPAVFLFLAFAWGEMVWDQSSMPAPLALAILGYAALTWTGMLVFGRHAWLRGGEAFAMVFGLLARFAPTEVRVSDGALCASCAADPCRRGRDGCVNCYACYARAAPAHRQWNLRPPGVGLLVDDPVNPSVLVFVLVMLSTVTFDGLRETPAWGAALDWLLSAPTLQPVMLALHKASGNVLVLVITVAMALFALAFVAVFMGFSRLMAAVTAAAGAAGGAGEPPRAGVLAGSFVLTLVPIAIAYHLAHYLSFLMLAGQFAIPLASDPFGFGWDLLGTAGYQVDIGVAGARFVWFTAVAAIVTGHVAAVCLAHAMAIRVFGDARLVVRSQYPMLVLMVGYTMISLWILSQPVVVAAGLRG